MNDIERDFQKIMDSVALESEIITDEDLDVAEEGMFTVAAGLKAMSTKDNTAGLRYPDVVKILTEKINKDKKAIRISDKEMMPKADEQLSVMKKTIEGDLLKTKIYTIAGVKVLFIMNKLNGSLITAAWYPYKTLVGKCDLRITTFKANKKVAAESLTGEDLGVAEEGLIDRKPKTTQDILNKYEKRCANLKSVEICDAFLAKLKEESSKFNSCLSEMASLNKEFSSGKITKAELKEKVKPCAEMLKKQCEILNIKKFDINVTAVTAEDLKKVKEVISGMIKIVNARKAELKSSGKANESVDSNENEDDIDAAFESLMIDMDEFTSDNDIINQLNDVIK